MSGEASVFVELGAEFTLSVTECFPDGEPDEWDAATVLAAIQKQGIDAWDLLAYGLQVRVVASKPNPHYSQGESLLPGYAPERWATTTAMGTAR